MPLMLGYFCVVLPVLTGRHCLTLVGSWAGCIFDYSGAALVSFAPYFLIFMAGCKISWCRCGHHARAVHVFPALMFDGMLSLNPQ